MKHLKPGDAAPDFTATDQDGNKISLGDYRGKKVILYFYPKDNTPGCTAQACNLRDNHAALLRKGYVVLGVSTDDQKSHKKFSEKFNLNFPLLVDEGQAIVKAYGVWGSKTFMGRTYDGTHRTTFLINEKGIIDEIIDKPDTKMHTEEVLQVWENRV
ncbi:peroxiredoxin Q/BCP [Chitinophaga costaii]|uniref:thioredoxin-dependent peroxiredoxin n=1 Tax=Chitinophaga costaii TaxID=1335309 RepID=A0A1C4FA32_9BACT|nr:thioredoxin-dependent thiol peroxidase [Chitinophaga costaii]PUZ21179.1 thioredoxin-dependent thiol peroxidase [Chitinophaga costaii]SCC52361.1 peroxiredoxin Q/BCP [Chitinophaga costaii]